MPRQTFLFLVSVLLASPVLAGEHDGAELYRVQCASCHGPDGRGDTPVGKALKVQSLLIPRWASEDSLAEIDSAVRAGVPGMAPLGLKLTETEIEAIARFVHEMAMVAVTSSDQNLYDKVTVKRFAR